MDQQPQPKSCRRHYSRAVFYEFQGRAFSSTATTKLEIYYLTLTVTLVVAVDKRVNNHSQPGCDGGGKYRTSTVAVTS